MPPAVAISTIVALAIASFDVAADSYLDAIESEANKVNQPVEDEPSSPDPGSNDRTQFEQELEKRYRGSYLFYKKLPARSQQEVFSEYARGASIEEVRRTIMSRFLHSR